MATVNGTSGDDVIDLSDGVTNDADYILGFGGDDTLKGLGGDDTIRGGEGNDHLYGGEGSDYLWGQAGDDSISGGGGRDYLYGGPGSDTLDGGDGYDTASYGGSPEGVVVSLLAGTGSGGDAQGDQLSEIEQVWGSEYNDKLTGDDEGNRLEGRGGSDQIKGFGGDDFISGGNGDDTLYGMAGDDSISGGDGDDHIGGGLGADYMLGNGDADTFVWFSTAEAPFATDISWPSGVDPNATDTIRDFNPAQGDLIDLSAIDADVYATGNQAFTFIGTADFSGTPGEVNYYEWCGLIFIQMQTGTSTDVEAMILLDWLDGSTHTPEASWFVL